MWALLPLKRFQQAKRRLKDSLTLTQREAFFHAMVEDVLTALAGSERLAGVLVISADERTHALASEYGAEWLRERGPCDLNGAITQGAQYLADAGREGVMVVPGDVPLITSAEVDNIVSLHGPSPAVTIVPASGDDGTNALLVSPPRLIEFAYGKGSREAHLAAARAAGVTPQRIASPGFAVDIDRPDELHTLLASGARRRSVEFLRTVLG